MDIDRRLSSVLSEFARTLVTDFPIQAILDHLVVRIVDALPITGAGVTLIEPGADPRYVAASDESALRFERLQTELGEGPCLAAYATGEAVCVPDLAKDDRFPSFGPHALAAGLAAVFTLPLRQGDHQLGALDLYRTAPGPLDAVEMAAAQTLADVTTAYLLNARSRAELRESSEQARHVALHDALTGLPNRTLLVQRLDHAILRCRRTGKLLAILFADLDRFKAVNDSFGHHVGEELLVAVASRLAGLLRPGDTLARLAGDEFAILCEDLDDASSVEPLAGRIGDALGQPFVLSGVEVALTASVGIAFAGSGDDVPEQVLQDADAAMYQVKRRGGGCHGVIDLRAQGLADRRTTLSHDLRNALAKGQLTPVYQPIVAMADGRIVGAEALLRWSHPTLGSISPEIAIPLAEQIGCIREIGLWMLERACLDLGRWQRRHQHGLGISVNVSVRQLMGPDFVSNVAAVLARTDTDPTLVTLEVTESVFIQDTARAILVFEELKQLGVLLALDDFGTGYVSMSYLNRFPVDVIKIDGAFIQDIGRDDSSSVIAAAIVGLARSLGMTSVAEGVENTQQFAHIKSLGCDLFQGFCFARPMSAANIETLLAPAITA